jgi:hypothetical protein
MARQSQQAHGKRLDRDPGQHSGQRARRVSQAEPEPPDFRAPARPANRRAAIGGCARADSSGAGGRSWCYGRRADAGRAWRSTPRLLLFE